ncbi:diaminobutyrate acetyltransferase [Mycolicibacterium thermoresistibile]|nr:diaminobutyrate acetyltransferase [Mycolicibacterium thermoresistibile]
MHDPDSDPGPLSTIESPQPPRRWDAHLRRPQAADALGMREIAIATDVLDVNSTYAYLLFATDFAATSIVADVDGELHGFITGYHPPDRPEVLFVWQVAAAPAAQKTGLASAMLDHLVHRVRTDRHGHPVTVEATVTPSNTASRAFFGAFARRHGVPLIEQPHFTADMLDRHGDHEDEPILRIGPITAPLTS